MSNFTVMGEWLAHGINQCTCYGGDTMYGHERGCGYEPVVKMDELVGVLEAAGYAVSQPVNHEFLPVADHPDDDECTYRSDGTDATYCGEPKARHQ